MKPINTIPRLIRIATAVIVAGGLAVMVLSAQDDLDTRWQAAEQGLAMAQFNLGITYASGRGVLKDEVEAVKWFRLAAGQGHANAQYNLGVRYAFGQGVLKDEAEAVRWYRLAAEQGLATAQFNLGVAYANGQGVLKDSVLAHMWYNIAGANGNEAARKLRDNLEDDMTRAEISRATELARACMASVAEKTTYFNNETVRGLWKDAAAALQAAAALYIIGYSLPISDLGMQFFLAGSSPDADSPVHVVNTDKNTLERYRKFLQRPDIRADYVGPDNPVVRFACDYADELAE